MRVVVCTVALGGWYHRGAARMIQEFERVSSGIEIQAHINCLPFGAPAAVIEDGWDYTAYCAKPFALMEAKMKGADIAILLDCAFFPIRHIQPLIDFIAGNSYYFCRNGARVGEWASDRTLVKMGVSRAEAMEMEEISSYCVGLNFGNPHCAELLRKWCGHASDRLTFPGPHTNMLIHAAGRNLGFVSADPAVKGHRHDQTVLSILAHRAGLTQLVERPRFTAYLGSETDQTVLVNEGM